MLKLFFKLSTFKYGTLIFALIGILWIFGLVCLSGWIFMLLWNWLAPLFWMTAPILNIWQGTGVVILLSIIGSFFRSSNK